MTNLVLASGQITNQDEITIALVEPADGTPLLVRGHWPATPYNLRRHPLPGCSGGDHTVIAESVTALARIKAHGK